MNKGAPKITLPTDFDAKAYLELNPDVAAAGVDPGTHYLEFGWNEGRKYRIHYLEKELATYSNKTPDEKNAFSLFSEAWSTKLTNAAGDKLTNGSFDGTNDARILWLCEKIDLDEAQVLELGPLEGAHSFMLEKVGAKVLSVEANIGAFLRCLVVKNQFELNSKFVLGDFTKMDFEGKKFDLVLASGVLYHMEDPVSLLVKLSAVSKKLFLWTHYFEENLQLWNPRLNDQLSKGKWNYKTPEIVNYDGMKIRVIKQKYGESKGWSGFCGGPEEYSHWLLKDELLMLLRKLGFNTISTSFDDVTHQNGPSFCVLAEM